MRVSTGQLSRLVLQGLQQQDREYARVMTQMSSGYRINRTSDDPLGSISLLGIEREQSAFAQYQANARQIQSRMEQYESYLNTSFSALLRVQDLVLTAGNGASTADDRAAVASELSTLRDTLFEFANARDDEGHYLFGGSQLDRPPLAEDATGVIYQGDSLRRDVPVANGVTIPANETIESVYFNGGNFFNDLDRFIADLEVGGPALATTLPAMIDSVERTVAGIGQKLTEVGARISSARSLETAQQDLALANEKIRGRIQDLDYVDAVSRVNDIQLALDTTQKTYSKLSQLSLFNYL